MSDNCLLYCVFNIVLYLNVATVGFYWKSHCLLINNTGVLGLLLSKVIKPNELFWKRGDLPQIMDLPI